MRQFTLLLITTAALFASCADSADHPPQLPTVPFSVDGTQPDTYAKSGISRAILDNKHSQWEAGDIIAVYASSYSSTTTRATHLAATEVSDDRLGARFEGSGTQPAEIDTYFGAYADDLGSVSLDSRAAVFRIPAMQATTSQPKLMLAAKSKENIRQGSIEFLFEPVNAFLHLTVPEGTTSVVVESCGGEALAGSYVYSFADGTTTLTGQEACITASGSITDFYIAIPAITLSKGYKLTLRRGEEQMIQSVGYSVAKTFIAGQIYNVNIAAFTPLAVNIAATTSYSQYLAEDIVGANAWDAETAAISGSYQGIPNALVAEAGYIFDEAAVPMSWNTGTKSIAGYTIGGLSWETHTVQAYIRDVFGRYYYSDNVPVVITGLPYKPADTINDSAENPHPWSDESAGRTGIVWGGSNVQLVGLQNADNAEPKVATPYFHTPTSINTYINATVDRTGSVKKDFKIYTYSTAKTATQVATSSTSGSYTFSNREAVLNSTTNRVLFHNVYGATYLYGTTVSKVSIVYRK